MNLAKRVSGLFGRQRARSREPEPITGGAVAHISRETFLTLFNAVLARKTGALERLTDEMVKQLDRETLRETIVESNSSVAKAAGDFVFWSNAGWTWSADYTRADRGVKTKAYQILDTFLDRLYDKHGGLKSLLSKGFRSMFTHGASFSELVFDTDAMTPLELKFLDPTTAVFRQNEDPVTGEYYELGQERYFGRGLLSPDNFVSLQDNPTIQYIPIIPAANYPYGLCIIDPSILMVTMSSGFFDSFNQALNAQVWPTNLISIDREKFKENSKSADHEQLEQKMQALIKDIIKKVGELKPGGVAVYADDVTMGGPISGVNRNNFGSVGDIHDIMDREITRGVGSQPILQGRNESVSETHADLQLISYGKLISVSQEEMGNLLTRYFNLILDANGLPKLAKFSMRSLNTAEYRDKARTMKELSEAMKNSNESLKSAVEAFNLAVEHNYMTREQAQHHFDAELELRMALELIPREF